MGHRSLEASWPGVSVLLYLRVPNPWVAGGKAARGHHLGPHGLLEPVTAESKSWERLRKEATTPGRCDLLSDLSGEPRGRRGASTTQQLQGTIGEKEPSSGKQMRRPQHSLAEGLATRPERIPSLSWAHFHGSRVCQEVPGPRGRGPSVSTATSAELLRSPQPDALLGQNQAHQNRQALAPAFSPGQRAGFCFQKCVA